MKKNIGSQLALNPMPVGVVSTLVDGKKNFVLASSPITISWSP